MNPFLTSITGLCGERIEALGAGDRVVMVGRFDRKQCAAALAMRELQTTVRHAVERRLRQLDHEVKP